MTEVESLKIAIDELKKQHDEFVEQTKKELASQDKLNDELVSTIEKMAERLLKALETRPITKWSAQ